MLSLVLNSLVILVFFAHFILLARVLNVLKIKACLKGFIVLRVRDAFKVFGKLFTLFIFGNLFVFIGVFNLRLVFFFNIHLTLGILFV